MIAPSDKAILGRTALVSGGSIDPWNPEPELIQIEDIAHGLANTNRYSGQTFLPYSVAQHSVYVSRAVPKEQALAALLHDAPEYITGDLPHHIKNGPGFLGACWRQLDDPIQAAVEVRFGIRPGGLYTDEIKKADELIFKFEWECLIEHDATCAFKIVPLDWQAARMYFLDTFARLTR